MKALYLKTAWMKVYTFLANRANDLRDLLNYMLTGLRQRSRYAVVMKNVVVADRESTCPTK